MRPDKLLIGGVIYWVIRTRNPDTQVLKDADSTPTVAIRKNGASTADTVTIVKRAATTGIYDCEYNPAGEFEGDSYTVEESATVTGTTTAQATYANSWSFGVVASVPTASQNANALLNSQVLAGVSYLDFILGITAANFSLRIAADIFDLANGWDEATGVLRDGLALEATLAAARDEIVQDIAGIEGGLTGDYTLTVTITHADTDDPIEAATVTLFRTGERGVDTTDDEGVVTFGVNAATWSYVVRSAGYQSATGTKVIAANDTLAVELTAIVQPSEPIAGTCQIVDFVLDSGKQPVEGATVRAIASKDAVLLDTGVLTQFATKAVTDATGRFELRLARADAMTAGKEYTIEIKHQAKSIYRQVVGEVPNQEVALLKEITIP